LIALYQNREKKAVMESTGYQEDGFFSDLLKEFRKRKKLTQSQLANRIEASREAVSLWERGEYKPETKGMVDTLVQALDLNDEEKRLLFEAYVGTASVLPLHNFPEHNPYFTGRETILKSLHAHLTADKQVALIQAQAISGLGGIGKTQVAIEYAYRFREHYHDILWVAADSRETLMTSYLTLARHLRLREREEREQSKVIEAIKRWLREHKGWLLILDNIEDLELVREFVPAPRQGAVVLTTRRVETGRIAQAIVLDVMPEEEGILLLLRRTGYLGVEATLETATPHHREAARAIVHTVGGLPLALDQAGAYIAENRCSLSHYLDLFKQEQRALLQRRGTVPSDHPQPVTMTFSLAFEQIQQKNRATSDLLTVCAFLAPDGIPLEVITEGAAHLGTVLEAVAVNTLQLDQALEILQAYSLVRLDGESRTLSIHRLVQAVLRDTLEEEERSIWGERAMRAVNAAFPHAEHDTWPQCERLLPHALIATQYIETNQIISKEAGRLLHETASYLHDRARYPDAEPLYQRAVQVRERLFGSEYPEVAQSLNGLAELCREQGKFSEAEPLYQRTLQIRERHLGSEHPEVAQSLTNLANLYYQQGKYVEAESHYQRALHIFEKCLGREHLYVAYPLNGLATLYKDQGKFSEAEPLHRRALHIFEKCLGREHLYVAIPLNNLAELCREWGKYAEAEPLYQRTLAINMGALGSEHPEVARSLNNLADLYKDQGKFSEAEPLYQRALAIWEQQLGPEHHLVAHPLNSLARLSFEQRKYADAERLFQSALRIREQAWGSQHPETAETMYGLAQLREAQGSREEAKTLYTHVLAVREQALGVHHPKTTETRECLITLLGAMERHEEATQTEAAQPEWQTHLED
jgi:tetratricopeptide (TPR) repeat protein